MISLLARKIFGERSWSLLIIGIITVGLIAWIVVPSVSSSIEVGLDTYANSTATWINISEHGLNGGPPLLSRLPPDVIALIESIPNVDEAYAVILNGTALTCEGCAVFNGTKLNAVIINEAAVLGGANGYPTNLVRLVSGRMPKIGSAEVIANGPQDNPSAGRNFVVNDTVAFKFRQQNSSSWEKGLLNLTATVVGIAAYNPVFSEARLLFDSMFLRQGLGGSLYNQTFGGAGANLVILKARTIQDVSSVASRATLLIKNYPSFSVIYDQSLLLSLQSFETNTIPLFRYIQYIALASMISVTLMVIYLATGRRRWEVGLLQTQGWGWSSIARFLLGYFLALSFISFAVGTVISVALSSFLTFSYEVLRGQLAIPVKLNLLSILSAAGVALVISGLACLLSVWRFRKVGLDTILREY